MEYTKRDKKIVANVYEECVDVEWGEGWKRGVDTDYKEFGGERYRGDKDVWLKVSNWVRMMKWR